MTREAWLTAALAALASEHSSDRHLARMVALPSFAHSRIRGGELLGEVVRTDDGDQGPRYAALVSPRLSDAVEVVTVLDYLTTRIRWARGSWVLGPRNVNGPQERGLRHAGYEAPFTRIVPGPVAVARCQRVAAALIEEHGPYPHEAVTTADAARPQTTRMLLASCDGTAGPYGAHAPYRVRLSASTARRGLPACPVCLETRITAAYPYASPIVRLALA